MSTTTAPKRITETQLKSSNLHPQTRESGENNRGTPVSHPSQLKTPSEQYSTKVSFKAPQRIIKKKSQTFSSKRQSTTLKPLSAKQQAKELESRLESSLTIAAGGISTLMENLIARRNSKSIKDEQLSQYITRLGVISEELKNQLKLLGKCSKLANQQDHESFDLSYRNVVTLWKEYQRVSASVVQRARLWKRASARNPSEKDDLSDATSMSNSSTGSGVSAERGTGKQ